MHGNLHLDNNNKACIGFEHIIYNIMLHGKES